VFSSAEQTRRRRTYKYISISAASALSSAVASEATESSPLLS
jgi:hypothetical protein